jgi:hypothetical protein
MQEYTSIQLEGPSLEQYSVSVRNEDTGEVRVVEIVSEYFVDAQIVALQRMFKTEGWRKSVALTPEARTHVA